MPCSRPSGSTSTWPSRRVRRLRELHAPIAVMPHGPVTGSRTKAGATGLVYAPAADLQTAAVLMDAVALSHDSQLEVLAAVPEAVDRAVVVGDICYGPPRGQLPESGRLTARRWDGAGQELVVVASTWGRDSLFARDGDSAAPACQPPPGPLSVAALIAPGVWFGHGRRQLRLAGRQREAGLMLAPPRRTGGRWSSRPTTWWVITFRPGTHASIGCRRAGSPTSRCGRCTPRASARRCCRRQPSG